LRCDARCHTSPVELRHRLLLRDSHASLLRDRAFVTNKTDAFQGVIDYIWFAALRRHSRAIADVYCQHRYTPAAFRLSRILDPRPDAEFNTKYPFSGVLPSPVAPSDHVLIAAEFDMVGR
jgi:hypothetical protein